MENLKRIIGVFFIFFCLTVKANNVGNLVSTLTSYQLQLEKGITTQNKNIPYTLVHQYYIPLLKSGKYPELKTCFNEFFNIKLINSISQSTVLSDLDKQIFYFFTAEYLRLYFNDNKESSEILTLLKTKTKDSWLSKSGKVWTTESLASKGKKERIDNILNKKYNGNKSYYSAITDNELFLLASATSLSIIDKQDKQLAEMRNYFYRILKDLVVFQNDGEWTLQPNVWKDHPDYSAVGKVSSVDWDTSHFSRMPAFLNLLEISDLSIDEKKYIKKLQSGLATKFLSKVTTFNSKNSSYSFNNYMNGNNKNYRVGYKTKPAGFSGGENYTHVFYGWWKLLNDNRINEMYKNILNNYSHYTNNNKQLNAKKELYKEVISL